MKAVPTQVSRFPPRRRRGFTFGSADRAETSRARFKSHAAAKQRGPVMVSGSAGRGVPQSSRLKLSVYSWLEMFGLQDRQKQRKLDIAYLRSWCVGVGGGAQCTFSHILARSTKNRWRGISHGSRARTNSFQQVARMHL